MTTTLNMPVMYPRFLVCRFVCHELGVPQQLFNLKLREGWFLEPNVVGPGGEPCYDQPGVEEVLKWWEGWNKYKRRKSVPA